MIHFATTLKPIHNNLSKKGWWLFKEEREKGVSFGSKWGTFFQSHNNHTLPASTQPQSKPKTESKPLKPSFSMKVHGCSRENKNELKERKNVRLSHLGSVNNHYKEEKRVLFLQNTKVLGTLMVVLGE